MTSYIVKCPHISRWHEVNSEQHYDIDDACNKTFTSYGQTRSPSILMFGHQTTILYQAYVYMRMRATEYACVRVVVRPRYRPPPKAGYVRSTCPAEKILAPIRAENRPPEKWKTENPLWHSHFGTIQGQFYDNSIEKWQFWANRHQWVIL